MHICSMKLTPTHYKHQPHNNVYHHSYTQNQKILHPPSPPIHTTEETLPRQSRNRIVAPWPKSEQINHPSPNHTYTKSRRTHALHHTVPYAKQKHTQHMFNCTHISVASGFVDGSRWSDILDSHLGRTVWVVPNRAEKSNSP